MWRRDPGQASVELLAVLPLLGLSLLLVAQLTLAGWTLWSAAVAARAGARADAVGGSAAMVARRALPGGLRRGARVTAAGRVDVRVSVPRLVPGLPRFAVTASSSLAPGSAGDS
jgi:hypothetical protein